MRSEKSKNGALGGHDVAGNGLPFLLLQDGVFYFRACAAKIQQMEYVMHG